jgi:1,4-alpha-glucan branching enzyme
LALLFLSALRFLRDTFGETGGPLIAHLLQRNPEIWRMIVSLRKQYRKTDALCTVTFSLPKAGVASARAVNIVSDFNGWNPDGNPMKKKKNGNFSASVTLARGREYQFRYLLDGGLWENDWKADKYVANEHGSENSVVVV